MNTYKELRTRALSDPEVRSEYERLNREEFALLDQMLAARHAAGVSQAQVAERMGTKAPAVTRLARASVGTTFTIHRHPAQIRRRRRCRQAEADRLAVPRLAGRDPRR